VLAEEAISRYLSKSNLGRINLEEGIKERERERELWLELDVGTLEKGIKTG